MHDDHIIYERERISPFLLDFERIENRESFPRYTDLIEKRLIQPISSISEIEENPIISIKKIFQSKAENTLIKIFNETKINDFFDRDYDNQINPLIFDFARWNKADDKTWQTLAAGRQVALQKLSAEEVSELEDSYVDRIAKVAKKIAEIALSSRAVDEIDVEVISKIIQLYQQRRENPKMEFFVSLAMEGNKALKAHLDALSLYSPFTPEQLQSIFLAAAGQKKPKNAERLFGQEDRLYYRMQVQGHNPIEEKISLELQKRGFKISSYQDGSAIRIDDTQGKQKYRIGKILKDEENLLAEFRDDPIRQMGQFLIVLSRNPDDIAKMSTDRAWVSCMASTGMFGTNNFHYVPKEIRQGALVAYVVKSSDPNIFDPLSRILLKPYKRVPDLGDFKNKSNYSEPGTIYIPGPNYGLPNDVFRDAVIGLSEKLNLGQPDGKYVMAEGCYEDGIGTEASVVNGRVQIESPFEFINQLHHNFMNQQNMHLAA